MNDGRSRQAMGIERTRQLEEVHTYVAGTMHRCTQLASSAKSRLEQRFPARLSFKEALYVSLFVLFSQTRAVSLANIEELTADD